MDNDMTLGFAGFGNMGMAIAQGLVAAGVAASGQIHVADPDIARQDAARAAGFHVAPTLEALARESSVLVLAVKPQQMAEALEALRPDFSPSTLVLSVAAGISTAFIAERLGDGARVVRAMPNTPALAAAGAAGIALGKHCTPEDEAVARTVFGAVGIVELVPEDALHAVTALSGSGPAYFFHLVECMRDAAVALGLPPDQAERLAVQTAYGAGKLLAESGESPAVLRERVTSKGGTTAAALETFGARGLAETVAAAMTSAAQRSRELGK